MPKESAAVMSEVGQGQTGLALDTKPARTLVGMASSLPANGEVAAETREEIRRETLVRPNAPAATVEERTRTSVVEARLLAMLREAASRTLDEPVQEELAKLIRVWNDITKLDRAELLPALDVATTALLGNPPNLCAAQRIREDLSRRVGGFAPLRQNSPAANVVLGLIMLLNVSILVLWLLAPRITPGATLAGMDLEMLLLVAAAGALGSIVSVMRRIRDFKGSGGGSPLVLYLTGAFKPIIGVSFALFVFAVFNSKLIAFSPPPGGEPYLFAAIGFLAGFSEKLAPDLIEKAQEVLTTSSVQQTRTVSHRGIATG